MSDITTIVSPGYLVARGAGVSEIQAGQPKPRAGRWTSSNPYCATDAQYSAVEFDLPKHALMTRGTTDVPMTGVPPSAIQRRT